MVLTISGPSCAGVRNADYPCAAHAIAQLHVTKYQVVICTYTADYWSILDLLYNNLVMGCALRVELEILRKAYFVPLYRWPGQAACVTETGFV